MGKIAVYAGTFDPVTLGHIWMIEQGIGLFDKLIVAVGLNPEKKPFLTLEERVGLLKKSTSKYTNITITHYSNQFLIKYAEEIGARYILRGIRNHNDYEYEKGFRNVNSDLNPNVTTVFLMPPREIEDISSSTVRGLIGPDGWEKVIIKYIPVCVLDKLQEMYASRRF